MKTTNTIALRTSVSPNISTGISTTIKRVISVISAVASAILAPVAYLQCAAGNPSLPVILGAATAILVGMALSHSSRKGGEL